MGVGRRGCRRRRRRRLRDDAGVGGGGGGRGSAAGWRRPPRRQRGETVLGRREDKDRQRRRMLRADGISDFQSSRWRQTGRAQCGSIAGLAVLPQQRYLLSRVEQSLLHDIISLYPYYLITRIHLRYVIIIVFMKYY